MFGFITALDSAANSDCMLPEGRAHEKKEGKKKEKKVGLSGRAGPSMSCNQRATGRAGPPLGGAGPG